MIEMLGQSFVRYALLASVLAGGVSAYLGVYVLLRRIVFVGIALAQIATLGVAVGHLLGLHGAEAAFGMSLVGVTFFAFQRDSGRIPRESAIGVAYAAASALTILCVSKSPLGELDVLSLIFGNVLGVTEAQLYVLAALARCSRCCTCCSTKNSCSPPSIRRWRRRWAIDPVVGVCVLSHPRRRVFLHSQRRRGTGDFLVPGHPGDRGAGARRRHDGGVRGGGPVAVSGGAGGVLLSYKYDLPTGPTIVAALSLALFVCWLAKALRRLRRN